MEGRRARQYRMAPPESLEWFDISLITQSILTLKNAEKKCSDNCMLQPITRWNRTFLKYILDVNYRPVNRYIRVSYEYLLV